MASRYDPVLQAKVLLAELYGSERQLSIWPRIEALLGRYLELSSAGSKRPSLTEADVVLIVYPDQVSEIGERPLDTLRNALAHWAKPLVSALHVLPMHPYSSDDGFSVLDYRTVNAEFGTWQDIEALADDYQLILDAVINHVSQHSAWFSAYKRSEPPYDRYFIEANEAFDVSKVYRARATPLLTSVETTAGKRHVWTSFSPDQIDLNYANPEVLLEMLDVLLSYVRHGAQWLRLDAAGLLWKESGTNCVHLPQTHALIQLCRSVLDIAAPHVGIVPQVNGPLSENSPYLGDGQNEAQMIYHYALPVLVWHALSFARSTELNTWLPTVSMPSIDTYVYNFLACHDGISLRPARGLIADTDLAQMLEAAVSNGGRINFRKDQTGQEVPYEVAITYYDALNAATLSVEESVARFKVAHAILLALAGVPAVYFQSLLGARSWQEGFTKTGINRTLNRRKYQRQELNKLMTDEQLHHNRVYHALSYLIGARRNEPAFDPHAPQHILKMDERIFGIRRDRMDKSGSLYALHNLSNESVAWRLESVAAGAQVQDLLGGAAFTVPSSGLDGSLEPYQVLWLLVRT
jgi:glycosidase